MVQDAEHEERGDRHGRKHQPARLPAHLNSHRGIAVVGQRESHHSAHDRFRRADGQAVLDGPLGRAVGK